MTFSAPGATAPKHLELEFLEDADAEDDQGNVIGDRNLWVAKVEVNGKSIDALAGRNDAVGAGSDETQAHGYVLPKAGVLSFDLATQAVPSVHPGGVSSFNQRWFQPGGSGAGVYGRTSDDVAAFDHDSSDYDVALQPDGSIRVTDMDRLDGDDGSLILHDIRWAHFEDRTLDLGGVWLARALAETPIDKAFYVAPDGNDAASGSRDDPFATLERARVAARSDESVDTVYVEPGDYWLWDTPLVLTAEDSGLRIIGLPGPNGERPVLHGGFEITGFEPYERGGTEIPGVWTASAPRGEQVYLDLTVNGERIFPAMPGDRSAEVARDWSIGSRGAAPDTLVQPDTPTAIPEGAFVEVFCHHWRWQDDIFTAKSVEGRTVQLDRTPVYYNDSTDPVVYRALGHSAFVADQQGDASLPEFGWSPEEGLVLQTLGDEAPEHVIAAQRLSVVALSGADDVILHGLGFADTRTPRLPDDASETSSTERWLDQAAVSLHQSDNTLISDSVFRNVGRGLNLHDSSSVRVLGSEFRDLGRSAIVLRGDSDGALIAGNRFEDIGEVMVGYAAVDLLSAGEVDHTTFAHNTVINAARSALSTGDESVYGRMYGTRILDNHIEGIGEQAGDTGGIHLFGQFSIGDTGQIVEGNVIKDVSGIIVQGGTFVEAMGDGIYVDVFNHDTTIRNNLVSGVSNAAIHVFGSNDVKIEQNYALLDRQGGEWDWQGDKFIFLGDRLADAPVLSWVETPATTPDKITVVFSNLEQSTVFVNSIEINGHIIFAPNPEPDPGQSSRNLYQWVTPSSPSNAVTFELPSGAFDQSGFQWLDKIGGRYASSIDNPGKTLIVLNAGYNGPDPHSEPDSDPKNVTPEFEVYFGDAEGEPVFRGAVPEVPALHGISVSRNVVVQELLPEDHDLTVVGEDYIRFYWKVIGVPLENDNISVDGNLLYNVARYERRTTDENPQALDSHFKQDQNSAVVGVRPLVPDDSGRGYGLHPEVAGVARKLGIADLGSNGLDLWSRAGVDGFDWRTYGGSLERSGAPRGTPAGYTWDSDSSQHVVYRDGEGHIRQLYYKAEEQVWKETDLSADTGAPSAASGPAAYTWDVDPSQHVVYRDTKGHIQELFFRAEDGIWKVADLTAETGAKDATGTPSGYTWGPDQSQHVVYRDEDGRIVELYYLAGEQTWKPNDLTEQAAIGTGGAPPLAAGSPFGYVWDGDGFQHVVYRGVDEHIIELVRPTDRDAWYWFDLTESTGAPTAAGDPVAYTWADDLSQHVVYRDTEGHIQQLYFKADEGVWENTDLTEDAGAPLAAGSPAAYTWDHDPSQHIVYRDAEGHIQELFFRAEDGIWKVADLTSQTGSPFAIGRPAGYSWDVDPSQHVVYASREGRIAELFYRAASETWLEATLDPSPHLLPASNEKTPIDESVYAAHAGVSRSQLTIGPSGDAQIVFEDEAASLKSVLGAYLVGPEDQIASVRIVFPEIEHRDPDPRYGSSVRPGGGPLAEGDAVRLSDLFADVGIAKGQEFGLFLASGAAGRYGTSIFEPGAGTFAFEDDGGRAATLATVDPSLVFTATDGTRTRIASDIFHASVVSTIDPLRNTLNDGGRAQVISGRSPEGDLEIRFEDVRYAGGADRDFNDLIIRVEAV